MAPGRGTNLYQGPETRSPLAGFEGLVVCSAGPPVGLSMPPTLSPVPSPRRTPPAPAPAGDLMDFQANELGVGLVPTPRERLPMLPRPSQLHPLPPTLPCCIIISAQKDPEKQVSPEEGEVGLGHPARDQLSQGSNAQGLGAQNPRVWTNLSGRSLSLGSHAKVTLEANLERRGLSTGNYS